MTRFSDSYQYLKLLVFLEKIRIADAAHELAEGDGRGHLTGTNGAW